MTDSNETDVAGDTKLIEPRRDYQNDALSRADLDGSPLTQFSTWLQDARNAGLIDATSMCLSTVDAAGLPHSRIVLLKAFDEQGFVWFTDRHSNKGQELKDRPVAAILFFWRELERQVRIEGDVSKVDDALSDQYFYSRPAGSRFSAAASRQSAPVSKRQILVDEVAELQARHPDDKVPRPPRWGGYRLQPNRFEFWQGRADRLHDRFVYTSPAAQSQAADTERPWLVQRLCP